MTEQIREATYTMLFFLCAMIILIGMIGCTTNHYKIQTVYANTADEVQITSEVEGKATIGKVANIYKQVLEFANKQYIPTKK